MRKRTQAQIDAQVKRDLEVLNAAKVARALVACTECKGYGQVAAKITRNMVECLACEGTGDAQ